MQFCSCSRRPTWEKGRFATAGVISIKNISGRYQIEHPFKQEVVNLPNNHLYVLNRMLKLEQRLKKNYFKFMGKLFKDGHAVEIDPSESDQTGKNWYQSHFALILAKKNCVVFDCSAKFQDVRVINFLYKGPGMFSGSAHKVSHVRSRVNIWYSQIVLSVRCKKEDQDFLRFLWYKNNDFSLPIVANKMTRLSFGLLPAQRATLFCLEQSIFDNKTNAS